MALRCIEGWDGYADLLTGSAFAAIVVDKYSSYSLYPSSTGIETLDDRYTDEKMWGPKNSAEIGMGIPFADNPEELVCGVYMKNGLGPGNRGATSSGWYKLIQIMAGSQFHILICHNGLDLIVRLVNSSTASATIGNILEPQRWNLIELKAKIHDSTGYWYLYVNGVEVSSGTSLDTKYSTSDVTAIRFYTRGNLSNIGDFYCCDLTGSTNNDVLGPFHIQGILPDANGDDSDWTPSANASNYTEVNEETANEGNYVESGTANQQDLYNYEDLSGTWDEIFGIQINSRLLLDTAGSETVAIVCSSNGTEDSANFTVTEDTTIGAGDEFQFVRILEDDPDTSNAWEAADIDVAQFGVKFI